MKYFVIIYLFNHFIGAACKGGKMLLRPSCAWCKDQDAFVVNPSLYILVECFKKICEIISHSPIKKHILQHDKEVAEKSKPNIVKLWIFLGGLISAHFDFNPSAKRGVLFTGCRATQEI